MAMTAQTRMGRCIFTWYTKEAEPAASPGVELARAPAPIRNPQVPWLEIFAQDVRQGSAHSRGSGFTAVVDLALGIGATKAIFPVVDAVLLRLRPYPDPPESCFTTASPGGSGIAAGSPLGFNFWREQTSTLLSLTRTLPGSFSSGIRNSRLAVPAKRLGGARARIAGHRPASPPKEHNNRPRSE